MFNRVAPAFRQAQEPVGTAHRQRHCNYERTNCQIGHPEADWDCHIEREYLPKPRTKRHARRGEELRISQTHIELLPALPPHRVKVPVPIEEADLNQRPTAFIRDIHDSSGIVIPTNPT
ncbi:MAG: hypothetical protein ACKV0T_11110 [Planctomycetales bacterium]